MDQDKELSTYVSALIASPEKLSASDVPVLQDLLERYPYFQSLHLLLAKAGAELPEAQNLLTTAVIHTNGELVYDFLHRKQWNQNHLIAAEVTALTEEPSIYELIDTKQGIDEQEIFDEIGEIDPHEFPVTELNHTEEPALTLETAADFLADADVETAERNTEHQEEEETTKPLFDIETAETDVAEEEETIVEVPTAMANAEYRQESVAVETAENEFIEEEESAEPVVEAEGTPEPAEAKSIPAIETQEDAFVLENIMSTDFFAFEQSFASPTLAAPEIEEAAEPVAHHEYVEAAEAVQHAEPEVIAEEVLQQEGNEVTNYHDEKMPYTFLWWLAKTRKEYQTIFQPYVSLKKNNPSELQQQYVEHIFHIQSPFNPEEILNNTPELHGDPKDVAIIDNFIKKDPQISPPRPDQIDNENKARKSAEDQNDVVSETLAKIYIEQMLYHKAIDTYDKLSLKFPEKSRYFADLIQSIKKKI